MTAISVAQYLRISTEHQNYSLENQVKTISIYAQDHGFEIVQTYSDEGRSGLLLKNRPELMLLLSDVIGGHAGFRAVLVYDVSRWGRFQDSDEAAHYEFVCKSAGVPVHYCAENFVNDNTPFSSIAKALKRTMAAEYSREMGARSTLERRG
jgi:DNA invertase Pin-like site-specific DNA recombinase